MKSSYIMGDIVTTDRKYKKRYNTALKGKVLKNDHHGRFVIIKTDDGKEHSVRPEFLLIAESD